MTRITNLMTTHEAARYLGLSRSWLEKARLRAEGPVYFRIQRAVRYRQEDLETWLARHVVPTRKSEN